jgi:hypothetical protein
VRDLWSLLQFNLVPLGIALLAGIVAGRWMFSPPPDADDQPKQDPPET